MPAIATKPTAAAKFETEVQQQLAQVVRRIRTHDLLCGVFLLGVVAFSYLAVVMMLDRWLELPAWARQLGLLGLLGTLGLVAFYGIVRPSRRSVNPLYAAREVEETVEDAKNSVVNWVDLQDKPMPEGVRALVAARAAKQFKDADLDKAGESKRLLWLGGVLGFLVVVLAALFMLYKPAVFTSLFGRAVNPFSSGAIATRTQIEIIEPKDRDLTVTAGQPVTITVQITGKVPDADAPDRLLVLLRHNQADENFDEVPLEPGSTTREWTIRLPERLVQNGFWYRVKGGDAETPEHRVIVRPKPTLSEFEVKYEYPEYLRMKPDTVKSPHLEAHRGTAVTITAKANRTLKDGRAALANQPVPVAAEIVGEQKDSLRVRLTLTETGTYRLLFNSIDGEANTDAPVYDLRVLSDQPPTAFITNPKEEELTLAVNDTLNVDAQIGDDFGIDKVTLRFKLTAPNQPAKLLKAKPFQNGQSFKRDADGTYPTALEYKDSVALPALTDEAGQAVELKPDAVLEYWLEAIDNCSIPQANLGKSKVQKVRLIPAKVEPQQKEELKKQAAKRQRDEAAHQQQQKKKLEQEARPEKESPQKPNAEPQGEKQDSDKPQSQPGEKTNDDKTAKPETKPGSPMGNDPPMPNTPAKPTEDEPKPMNPNDAQPMGKGAQDAAKQDLQKQADDINKKLNDLDKQAGEAKGNDQPQPGQEAASGEKKSKPMAAPEQGEAKPAGDMTMGTPGASDEKSKGNTSKPEPTADPKPMGEEKPSPMNPNEKTNGGDPQEKQAPLGGAGGQEKPTPQPKSETKPEPKEPMPKSDKPAEQGGEGRSAAGEKKDKTGEGPKPESEPMDDSAQQGEQRNPAGSAKKNGQPKPSEDRAGESPKEEKGGDARGEKPTPAGQAKKGPPPDAEKPMSEPKGGSADTKPMPNEKSGDAAAAKNEGQAQPQGESKKADGSPMGDQKAQENPWKRGAEKPSPKDANGGAEQQAREEAAKDLAGEDKAKKEAAREKLDKDIGPDKRKELEKKLDDRKKAAENLNSKDEQKRLQGEEQLKDLQREQMEGGKEEERKRQQGDAEQLNRKDEIQKAAKDLNSDDQQKREAAEKKLDELVGKDAREKAKQLRDDLKSGDKDRQKAAKDELNELQKKAKQQQQQAQKGGEKGTPGNNDKEQAAKNKENEEAMKDLAGNDEKKKDAARKTLDKNVGEDARKKAEENLAKRKDAAEKLNSKDAAEQAQGKQEAEKLQREEIERGNDEKKANDADRLDRKELEEAIKDLNSDDESKKKAAQDKLDKAGGKAAREKAEQMMKDLQSGDKDREKAAKDELKKIEKEAQKQAQKDGKGEKGEPPLSKEEIEKLAKAAEDLNSKDDTKRKDAEKQLDDKLGEKARKDLQDKLKDGKEPSPEQAEAAKKAIEELAKNMPKPGRGPNDNQRDPRKDGGIGNTTDETSKPLEANKNFDKQAGQLQLEKLKKAEANKELQKKLGYTEEEYKRFLEGYQKLVNELPVTKDEKADASKPTEPTRPTTRVDGSGTVERRANGSTSTTNTAGVSAAPPGYGDARKKFAESATKSPKDESKK